MTEREDLVKHVINNARYLRCSSWTFDEIKREYKHVFLLKLKYDNNGDTYTIIVEVGKGTKEIMNGLAHYACIVFGDDFHTVALYGEEQKDFQLNFAEARSFCEMLQRSYPEVPPPFN